MTDIIMVKGRASNNVGRALSKMLEATKPVKAVHGAQAGESVKSPAPHNSPELLPLTCSGNGSLPAGGGVCPSHQPPPALSFVGESEEMDVIHLFNSGSINEQDAICRLIEIGFDLFEAMDFVETKGNV